MKNQIKNNQPYCFSKNFTFITISYFLLGRKVEIKKESEVWTSDSCIVNNGGADGSRTHDLYDANVSL